MNAKIKVRQPLAKVEIILANQQHQGWLEEHRDVVAEELNVEEVEFTDEPDKYIHHEVVPNFKLLGPKLGKLLPKAKKWLSEQTGAELLANLRDNGKIDLTLDGQAIQLSPEELEVRITAREGWTAANDKGVVVVLATELTPELIGKGLAREIVRTVNDLRKETGCQFTDRIELAIITESTELQQAIRDNSNYIKTETQADLLSDRAISGVQGAEREIGDYAAAIYLRVKNP
jgi:isoleucyl-tRNA synthetase